jgi:hypothetical protein
MPKASTSYFRSLSKNSTINENSNSNKDHHKQDEKRNYNSTNQTNGNASVSSLKAGKYDKKQGGVVKFNGDGY